MFTSKGFLGLAALSAASPALMGASGLPLPQGAPIWLPWFLSLAGPALMFLMGAGVKGLAAYLRAKARQLKADKDPSNDAEADALDAVAGTLDKVAEKKGE